jgi:cytochrome c553
MNCSRCQIRLDAKTLSSLKSIVGPWFLLDYRNPTAPGVTWAKFQAMIERGSLKKTSVIRGPTTAGLWRYAQDTPIVASRLGLCWSCHEELEDRSAEQCPKCRVPLNRLTDTSGLLAAMLSQPAAGQEAGGEQPEAAADEAIDETPLRQAARRFESGWVEMAGSSQIRRLAGVLLIGLACVIAFFLAMGYGRDLRQSSIPPAAETPVALTPPVSVPPVRETPVATPTPTPAARPAVAPASTPPATPEPASPAVEVKVSPNATGELFPEKTPAAPAVVASAPAVPKVISEAERQRRSAVAMANFAQDAAQRGDLAGAVKILSAVTKRYDKSLWPPGVEEQLQQFQQGATTQPEVKGDALIKQWQKAQELLDQAKASETQNQFPAAQQRLLQIIKQLPSQAWPNDMLETLMRVEERLAPEPAAGRASPAAPVAPPAATQPAFFGVEPA